ncbi:helix-turn-helix domain-containing protein [Streptomyces sp. NPDC055036]
MSSSDRVQTVRNAWINALRAEVLRDGVPAELPRIANVGVWIATYADADGGGAFPSRETLGTLAGCAQETVTRCVKVLIAVGMLTRRRRPNASSVYQLLIPVSRPDWAAHIHLYTNTRQRKAHAAKKADQVADVARKETSAVRTASVDADRTASTDCVPDSVHDGGSEHPPEGPDSVHGRPRTASMDTFRTASMVGPYQYNHPYGVDPDPDHNLAEPEPQPQVRAGAGAREKNDSSPQPPATSSNEPPLTFARCSACGERMIPDPQRPNRDRHTRCTPIAAERTAS